MKNQSPSKNKGSAKNKKQKSAPRTPVKKTSKAAKSKPKKERKRSREERRRNKKVSAIQSMSADSCVTEEEDSSAEEDECEENVGGAAPPAPPIPQAMRVPNKKILPGAMNAQATIPSWYTKRILEEERPDLAGKDGRFEMETMELDLLDRYVRERAELQIDDLIVTDDNYDEDDRRFVRYEIQLKYNEGRYSAVYIVSKQICNDNNIADTNGLFALKTGLRNGSSTFNIKMKRELRMLNLLTKARASWAPLLVDSGTVCDMPFIVMGLLDMNIEKLREMLGGKFRQSSAFYIAGEVLNGLQELHRMGFVHRDVKPTNICVGVGGMSPRVYIIDFGETVRVGKKIRYGTPDAYTLPFWSVDFHRRRAATEKSDLESWFYTITDLFVPSIVTWRDELSEPDVEKAKTDFWTDIHSNMTQSPMALIAVAETFTQGRKVDTGRLKKYIRAGLEQCVNLKKFTPEWVKCGTATAVATPAPVRSRSAPREATAT
ncbi:hypothetical protein Aduo_017165 [Ancylostoma duodenale]